MRQEKNDVVASKPPKKKKGILFYFMLALCLIFCGAIGAQAVNENGYQNIEFHSPEDIFNETNKLMLKRK